MFGLRLPVTTRMTVARLADGGLWLHSPITPDPGLFEALAGLGPVRWLVAPNTVHYWWLADWAARFPQAQVHAAPGLRRWARRALPDHEVMGSRPPAAWAGQIDQLVLRGDRLTEVVFLHRASRTLVLTDLIEDLEPERIRGPLYRCFHRRRRHAGGYSPRLPAQPRGLAGRRRADAGLGPRAAGAGPRPLRRA